MKIQPETIGLEGFGVAIDRDAEVPIGVQLAWALRTRIRDGRFRPSQRLPGLRDLAEAIGVNVNTVRAVYQRLEHEGLIDSQQGSGTFVASTPHRPSAVGTIAADAAREAQATGVDPREVAAALYVTSESPAPPADEAAERRRLLRTQIAGLERTLGELKPGIPASPRHPLRGAGARARHCRAWPSLRMCAPLWCAGWPPSRRRSTRSGVEIPRARQSTRRSARQLRQASALANLRSVELEARRVPRPRGPEPNAGYLMAGTYFLGMVLGVPLVIFVLALLAGYLNRDRDAEVLDWKPTRSPEREAQLEINEIDQMRASLSELPAPARGTRT